MKVIIFKDNKALLRFDKRDEVIQGIADFCRDQKITAATLTIIGAIDELVLSYYNLDSKQYEDHQIKERLEITGVIGNVGVLNDQPAVHAHGTFSNQKLQVIGGHIKQMTVSATAEVAIIILPGVIQRSYDEDTGLNLMK